MYIYIYIYVCYELLRERNVRIRRAVYAVSEKRADARARRDREINTEDTSVAHRFEFQKPASRSILRWKIPWTGTNFEPPRVNEHRYCARNLGAFIDAT